MTEGYEEYRTADIESRRLRDLAHAELSKYRECQRCLERQKEKITRQESRINAVVKPLKNPEECPAIQFTSDPKAVEDLLINAAELRTLYDRQIAYSEGRLQRIEKLIAASGLSEIQAEIIDRLYLKGSRAPRRREAAEKSNYGKTRFYEILNDALELIGKRADTSGHLDRVK